MEFILKDGRAVTESEILDIVKFFRKENLKDYFFSEEYSEEYIDALATMASDEYVGSDMYFTEEDAVEYAKKNTPYYSVLRPIDESLQFEDSEKLKEKGVMPTAKTNEHLWYEAGYKVVLKDFFNETSLGEDAAENIYIKNNMANRPLRDKIYSMSVGDIIWIHLNEIDKFYFVDSFRFERLEVC